MYVIYYGVADFRRDRQCDQGRSTAPVSGLGRSRWPPSRRRRRHGRVLQPKTRPSGRSRPAFEKKALGLRNARATSQTLAGRPVVIGIELVERICLQNLPGLLSAIACNYSISSNDRSPPNPAVDKQALILPSTNRRFAIEFQAVRSCCNSAMPRSDPLEKDSSLFCFSNHLNVAWLFHSIPAFILLHRNRHRWRGWVGKRLPGVEGPPEA